MSKVSASVFVIASLVCVSAEAEGMRHNNIRNNSAAIQQQLQQLPVLNPVPAAVVQQEPLNPTPIALPEISTAKTPAPVIIAKPKAAIIVQPEVVAAPQPVAPVLAQTAPVAVPEVSNAQPVAQPEPQSIANLSPKTQSILGSVGAGIGSDNSAPQKIVIEQGGFENPEKESSTTKKNQFEAVGEDIEKSAAFEIEVSNKAPSVSEYELLKKANKAMEVDQYEAAIALYQQVLASTPDNRDAMFGMATAYQKAGRKNRAKEIYSQIFEKSPTYEPALSNLLALAAEEAPERALAEFAAIEGRNPNFAGVYAQKAKIYRNTLNLPLAIKNLSKALELNPENQNYRYDLAIVEDENQNYAAASKHYAELIDYYNKGVKIPVDKEIITDRMNYINTL